jgi:hypothetical protein
VISYQKEKFETMAVLHLTKNITRCENWLVIVCGKLSSLFVEALLYPKLPPGKISHQNIPVKRGTLAINL